MPRRVSSHDIMQMRCVSLVLIVNFVTMNCQLFTMDQSKILRIYGDILPKKSSAPVDNRTVTEKLHVKHYSNSKINSYLNTIHKNQWFEQNRVEHTPKTILEVNGLLNKNQDGEWVPPTEGFVPHWGGNNQDTEVQDPGWSVSHGNSPQNSDGYYSQTEESPSFPVVVVKKNTKKRHDGSYYNEDTDYSASNNEPTDWSTPTNNFVTVPRKESRPQYSTIYKQHKTKYDNLSNEGKGNMKTMFNDWSTPRSMSAYSEWLTTPQSYTTPSPSQPSPSQPSNNWLPNKESNWVTAKPTHQPLSTSGPDLDEFIARQENRYNKYNNLYSGVNSYGDPSQDIFTKPRDYRQTVNNNNNNYNPTILKDQFDIPPNLQSYDPYSEYQDYSTSTASYPNFPRKNIVSSTTKRSPFETYQTTVRPYTPNSINNDNYDGNNRYANNNYHNTQYRPDFAEPDVVIGNKYQNTLKKHFDNTINLYESQAERDYASRQRNKGAAKINFEIPNANIKFEVSSTERPPMIIIENYHTNTEHPQHGFSEVYNKKTAPPVSQNPNNQLDSVPQYTQNDLQLPANYDYTPKKPNSPNSVTGATFTSPSIPIVEIGGGYGMSYFEGNNTLSYPAISYEIPHLKKFGKLINIYSLCRTEPI